VVGDEATGRFQMVIESVPKFAGMAYAIIATIAVIVLFRTGRFNRRVGYLFLGVSTVLGFLLFAPMLPYQMQVLVSGNASQLGVPAALAGGILLVFIVLTFVFGRAFCGYACPIGAVQELLYLVPGRKLTIRNKAVPTALRLLFLVAFIALAAGFSIGLLKYLGVRDFFYLNTASAFFFVFLALLLVSVFVYRPFCRLLCPYGALLSLAAIKGRFKLRRNVHCKDCKKCEKVCPTNEAGRGDLKQECYLCNRCKEACRLDALDYTTRQVQPAGDRTAA